MALASDQKSIAGGARIPRRLEHLTALDGLVLVLAVVALAAAGFGAVPALALVACAAPVAALRIALTLRDGRRWADAVRRGERIDPLTGLGNRRALLERLEEHLAEPDGPLMVAVFALDGLQHYNETYGALAGDALVRRLAQRLAESAADSGEAYRPSGGRFAVIQQVGRAGFGPLLSASAAALSEEGDGFCIDALAGVVLLPAEAQTPEQAMRVADRRLMARRDALAQRERPSLRTLVTDAIRRHQEPLTTGRITLAELARRTAQRLGMDPEACARTAMASELQAVGKLAVPREILAKNGPLDSHEWEFIEHHALVGERIVEIAVEAPDVAAIVRASHERFDGTGYPDRLAGDAIPLEARVASVCGAYEAMLTPRPHRPARGSAEALDELARMAGSQFDPEVVRAFRFVVAELGSAIAGDDRPRPTPVEG